MKTLKLLGAALAAVTMTFTAQAEKTAKAVVEDYGATLRFVYDETNHGTKDVEWFSVAEAEMIDPDNDEYVPWYGKRSTVTKVVFDSSFAAYRPKQCGSWFYDFGVLAAVDGLKNLNTSVATSMARMFCFCSALMTLDVSGFDTANVTDMSSMFLGCESLTSLNLASFDTAKVVNMTSMFEDCSSLMTLDVSGFDTANVTDIRYMFFGCSSLEAICASDLFVTDKVSVSSGMFENCSKLKGGAGTEYNSTKTDATYAHIDGDGDQPGYFTRAPTAKVLVEDDGATLRFVYDNLGHGEKGTKWFSVAEAEAIDPYNDDVPWCNCGKTVTKVVFDSSFAAYRPKQCGRWFYDFGVLAAVDGLKNLNTSVATSMAYMFSGCTLLKTLDVSGFDTANVTDMGCMFYNCSSLKTLDITGFDTAKVTDMGSMFYNCSSLESLDITGFDTAKVTDMSSMFSFCIKLRTIYASDGFVTKQVSDSFQMFFNCLSLTGGEWTMFDSSKTDKAYACIDTSHAYNPYVGTVGGQPGYFTRGANVYKIRIRFAANGGTGTMDDQICERDKVYNLTKCAFEAPDGKAFAGWVCKKTGKRYDDGILIFNAAEGKVLTLTAVWKE